MINADIARRVGKHNSRITQVFKQIKECKVDVSWIGPAKLMIDKGQSEDDIVKFFKNIDERHIRQFYKRMSPKSSGENSMPDRNFEVVRGYIDPRTKKPSNCLLIRCGASGCNRVEQMVKPSIISHTHAAQHFRNNGWIVGGNFRADRCPKHAHSLNRPQSQVPTVKLEPKDGGVMKDSIAPKPAIPSAEGSRAMSREDKRIVFSKLDEVYIDEKTGYSEGWNDEKVAKSLGCPRAWVAVVRDENFGPEKTAQDIRKILEEIQEQLKDLEAIERGIDSMKADLDAKFELYEKICDEVKKLASKV
jgi:hypothetical protein